MTGTRARMRIARSHPRTATMGSGVVVGGRYRIVRVIGEGGMGIVFEAEHTGLGRRVALKALREGFVTRPEVVLRFHREARAAAAIEHDNIIEVLDVGLHGGVPFMVMEMLDGEVLEERLRREGKLPVEQAVRILTQVLSAAGAAHKAGIVHRDLKPGNVFLTQRAGVIDFVKLLDFGIAKVPSTDEPDAVGRAQSITVAGTILGTPDYMAPEQALAACDLDSRTDLYAAGVMLYEMTTGTVPFAAVSDAEVLLEIAYRKRPLPSPSMLVPGLPHELDYVVLRAMSLDRQHRFQTADEFARALAPFAPAPECLTPVAAGGADRTLSFGREQLPRDSDHSSLAPVTAAVSPASVVPPQLEAGHEKPGTRSQISSSRNVRGAVATALAVALACMVLMTVPARERSRIAARSLSVPAHFVARVDPVVRADRGGTRNMAAGAFRHDATGSDASACAAGKCRSSAVAPAGGTDVRTAGEAGQDPKPQSAPGIGTVRRRVQRILPPLQLVREF